MKKQTANVEIRKDMKEVVWPGKETGSVALKDHKCL